MKRLLLVFTLATSLLAYYSSHEYPQPGGVGHNPANIYLAHLRINHVQP